MKEFIDPGFRCRFSEGYPPLGSNVNLIWDDGSIMECFWTGVSPLLDPPDEWELLSHDLLSGDLSSTIKHPIPKIKFKPCWEITPVGLDSGCYFAVLISCRGKEVCLCLNFQDDETLQWDVYDKEFDLCETRPATEQGTKDVLRDIEKYFNS